VQKLFMAIAILLVLSLALDMLAVAIGLGMAGLPRAKWLRAGLVFAVFAGAMPIIGVLFGEALGPRMGRVAGYISALALAAIGSMAIWSSLSEKGSMSDIDLSTPDGIRKALVATGVSATVDNLAVGFVLGELGVSIAAALIAIIVQVFVVTVLGYPSGSASAPNSETPPRSPPALSCSRWAS
jgi:manganese efflux pump family protein